jgi:hypothetical protein
MGRPPGVPNAPKGNKRGVRHGGLVTRKSSAIEMAAKQEELEAALAKAAPARAPGDKLPIHDKHIVGLLAATMVQFDNMTEFSREHGFLDEHGDPLTFVDVYGKVADRIARLLDKMGMTPASRAKLGLALVKQATLAEALSEPDRDKRMEMLNDLGVIEGEGEEVTDAG